MKKLRVLLLLDADLLPPDSIEDLSEKDVAPFKTEYDVLVGLRSLGHEVRPLGLRDDLGVIRAAIDEWKPDIAFNLLEEFAGVAAFVPHVVSYLELMRQPYTGCNPRGLLFAQDKALTKKILSYHHIRVPDFAVFARGKTVRRPRRLGYPLLVKSLTEEGSVGIAQASIVHDDEKLAERVEFIHENVGTDAIAAEYIDGRELYVGVVGNQRLQTLPVWELLFTGLPDDAPRIATHKVKWDREYQKRHGIVSQAVQELPDGLDQQIPRLCKRIYRLLGLSGYARIDLRLDAEGQLYVLEANPNPQLAYGEDLAESARAAGIAYMDLLQRILNLGLGYEADWHV